MTVMAESLEPVLDVVAATTTIVLNFLIVIGFKQDELSFHVFYCYQDSSESGEMVIMSYKTWLNFKTKRF